MITIPFIPFMFAIFAFMFPTYALIDEDDRVLHLLYLRFFQYFSF